MIGKPQPVFRWISALTVLGLVAGVPAVGQAQPRPEPETKPAPPEEPEDKDRPSPDPDAPDATPAPAPARPTKKVPPILFDPADPRIDEEMIEAITEAEGEELTRDIVAEVLAPRPDGLQPNDVADKAMKTSPSVASADAQVAEASARLDQAFAAYFPRVSVGASYTRLSRVEMPDFSELLPSAPTGGPGFEFPQVLDQVAFNVGLEVPISDYILRLTQGYAAASDSVESRELAAEAERIKIRAQAKAAYFNWIRAQGRAVVSGMGVALSRRHLQDAELSFAAGVIAGADVARLKATVAQSRHLLNTALALERVVAMQLRRIMHVPLDTKLAIGVDVMADPPPKQKRTLPALIALADKHRLDLRALEKQRDTFENLEDTTKAGYAPRLSAFANGLYARPNPRVFPAQERFDFTWEAGVRLTWTINDTFQTLGAVAEAEAKTAQVEEQLRALEDGVIVAVTQSYSDLDISRSAIEAAKTREEAAKKSLDARRKLFRGGRATATDIIDAERELIEARLQRVDAHVDLLVARANLEQAVGTELF